LPYRSRPSRDKAGQVRGGFLCRAVCLRAKSGARRRRSPASPQRPRPVSRQTARRSEEHTSELQSPCNLVCRLLLEKKKKKKNIKLEITLNLYTLDVIPLSPNFQFIDCIVYSVLRFSFHNPSKPSCV